MSSSSLSRMTAYIIIGIYWLINALVFAQVIPTKCPPSEAILPCKCHVIRNTEYQIWCSHSDLSSVLNGLKKLSEFISTRPIDELILENNNIQTLPSRAFYPLNVLRLMLRYNNLERINPDSISGLEDILMELFVVEPDLRTLPQDVFDRFRNLEAITIQSNVMKRLPKLSGLEKLRYLQVDSSSLMELSPRNFRNVPFLEKLHIHGSSHLTRLEGGIFKDMPNLNLINISYCGITWIHPRAFTHLPTLIELSLIGNKLRDVTMVGRGVKDLTSLQILRLDLNNIDVLREGSFVDLPSLKKLYISNNQIEEIHHGAFHRVPSLRMVDLNNNIIKRIHPESFLQHSDSGLEELWLVNNDINHIAELRSLLDALPRLVFLELSHNNLEEIRFGELRGHPTLERLHLDYNKLRLVDREAFMAMPALRELRLKNNTLSDLLTGPLWNLPSLKGLDLSGNFYRTIDARLLINTPGLRKIDMSQNEVVFLDPEAFASTPSIESLNLSHNSIASIHPSSFRHLINLYEIDLSYNRIIEVVPGLPRRLEYLHLAKNLISILPYETPELDLPSLRMLDLNNNLLTMIQPGAFRRLPQLRKLYAGNNAIERIDESSFDGLSRLEVLDCHANRIRDIHPLALKEMIELRELNLNENQLAILRPETIENLPRLKRVYLQMNRLKELLPEFLENIRDAEVLDASYNSISILPVTLRGLKQLKKLYLNKNRLRSVSPDVFDGLLSLNELVLSDNLLKELRAGTFGKNLKNLRTLLLDNNLIESIESNAITSLLSLKILDLSHNKLRLLEEGALRDLPQLQVLELQENNIRNLNNEVFKSIPHLMMLNVSHNRLSQLDDAGIKNLPSLEILDVSNNHLNRVTSQELDNLEWLIELRADNNKICAVHGPAFNAMPRLKVLSLRNNNMMSFPEDALRNVRTNIAVLNLEGNPLACNCNLMWLQTWLLESSIFGPRCIDGTPLREVRFSRQECTQNIGEMTEAVAPGCEAELLSAPGLAQLVANATKASYIKNNLAPSPEESEYFYDDYVDYPYNETNGGGFVEPVQLIDKSTKKPNVVKLQNTSSHFIAGDTPTIYAAANKTKKPPNQIPDSPSSSGFTFFGLPLPSFNLNKLWGSNGRMNDGNQFNLPIAERKSAIVNHPPFMKIDRPSQPEFQTGGFKPLLPGSGGFKPIIINENAGNGYKQNDSQTAANKDNVALHIDLQTKKDSVTTVAIETTTIANLQTTSTYKTIVNMHKQMVNLSTDKFVANSTFNNTSNIDKTPSNINKTSLSNYEEGVLAKSHINNAQKISANVAKTPPNLEQTVLNILQTTEPSTDKLLTVLATTPAARIAVTPTMIVSTQTDFATEITTEVLNVPINRTNPILDHEISKNTNITKIQTKLSIESTPNTIIKTYNNTRHTNSSINIKQNVNNKKELIAEDMYAQIEVAADVPSQMRHPGTLLTDFLVPKQQQQQQFRGKSTITKVQSPQQEKEENAITNPLRPVLDLPTMAAIQNNRETKQVKLVDARDDKSWYFANYNNTNLTPYVGSRIELETNKGITVEVHKIILMIPVVIFNIV